MKGKKCPKSKRTPENKSNGESSFEKENTKNLQKAGILLHDEEDSEKESNSHSQLLSSVDHHHNISNVQKKGENISKTQTLHKDSIDKTETEFNNSKVSKVYKKAPTPKANHR